MSEQIQRYPIKCDSCGKEDAVPFKPDPSRPVYCRECHRKMIEKRRGGDPEPQPRRSGYHREPE